ncbi:hypothetical protein EJ110_NYTH22710 [Nymphaea thermarum]|nr:hypothetical protein EJ110_NYTH22710 [Nymphaea thermarum]
MGLPGTSFNPNKHLKEEFVSNLTGSSMVEIFALSTIVPAFTLLRKWNGLKSVGMQNQNFIGPKGWRQYFFMLALDFLVVVLPPALFFTVLAEWTYICAGCMMLLLVVIVAIGRKYKSSLQAISPLILLGFARLVFTKGVDYQVYHDMLMLTFPLYCVIVKCFVV